MAGSPSGQVCHFPNSGLSGSPLPPSPIATFQSTRRTRLSLSRSASPDVLDSHSPHSSSPPTPSTRVSNIHIEDAPDYPKGTKGGQTEPPPKLLKPKRGDLPWVPNGSIKDTKILDQETSRKLRSGKQSKEKEKEKRERLVQLRKDKHIPFPEEVEDPLGMDKVVKEMGERKLDVLNIDDWGIGSGQAARLAKALNGHSTLTIASLHKCNIGELGAKHLGKCLSSLTSLEILDLGWNNIGPDGAAAICDNLSKSVKAICFRWNGIGDLGGKAVARALRRVPSITECDLEGNGIEAAGANHLAKSLLHVGLKRLHTHQCNFDAQRALPEAWEFRVIEEMRCRAEKEAKGTARVASIPPTVNSVQPVARSDVPVSSDLGKLVINFREEVALTETPVVVEYLNNSWMVLRYVTTLVTANRVLISALGRLEGALEEGKWEALVDTIQNLKPPVRKDGDISAANAENILPQGVELAFTTEPHSKVMTAKIRRPDAGGSWALLFHTTSEEAKDIVLTGSLDLSSFAAKAPASKASVIISVRHATKREMKASQRSESTLPVLVDIDADTRKAAYIRLPGELEPDTFYDVHVGDHIFFPIPGTGGQDKQVTDLKSWSFITRPSSVDELESQVGTRKSQNTFSLGADVSVGGIKSTSWSPCSKDDGFVDTNQRFLTIHFDRDVEVYEGGVIVEVVGGYPAGFITIRRAPEAARDEANWDVNGSQVILPIKRKLSVNTLYTVRTDPGVIFERTPIDELTKRPLEISSKQRYWDGMVDLYNNGDKAAWTFRTIPFHGFSHPKIGRSVSLPACKGLDPLILNLFQNNIAKAMDSVCTLKGGPKYCHHPQCRESKGLRQMAYWLKNAPNEVALDVGWNFVSAKQQQGFTEAIQSNVMVRSILCWNSVGGEGSYKFQPHVRKVHTVSNRNRPFGEAWPPAQSPSSMDKSDTFSSRTLPVNRSLTETKALRTSASRLIGSEKAAGDRNSSPITLFHHSLCDLSKTHPSAHGEWGRDGGFRWLHRNSNSPS